MANEELPLNTNGPAYASQQRRVGVTLSYIGEKLGRAIEALQRHGQRHPEQRQELPVAYLGLHNMLARPTTVRLPAGCWTAPTTNYSRSSTRTPSRRVRVRRSSAPCCAGMLECKNLTPASRAMGERIAALRKAHNVTQVQLAEALGVSQQTLQSYEVGRRRVPVSALPVVAHTLAVSLDELFGEHRPSAARSGKRGPAPQWQQQIEAVAQLPKSQQQFVARMIETVLAQAGAR